MKKTLKTILSLAFALLLVFQFAGSMDAYAAGEFKIDVTDGGSPGVDMSSYVTIKAGDKLLSEASKAEAQTGGITFYPADDLYYVKNVYINGVEQTGKLVATENNTVRLTATAVSALDLSSSADVWVVLGVFTNTDYAAYSFDPANAGTSGSTLKNNPFKAPDMDAEAKADALKLGLEFAGWDLVYANGATREGIKAGDNIAPYMDFTLRARWNEVVSVTVTPLAQEKVYDGTAALVNDGSDPSHYSFKVYKGGAELQYANCVVSGGSIIRTGDNASKADAGEYPITASGVSVSLDGTAVASSNIFYGESTFTISKRPVKIYSTKTTVEYSGEKMYPSGVYAHADTPLAADHVIDPASVEFDKGFIGVCEEEHVRPTKAIIRDKDGNDVSANYAISYKVGTLTITKRDISIAPADNTVAYDGKDHTISYKVTAGSLAENDTLEVIGSSAHRDKKTYEGISIDSVVITNSLAEADLTYCYNITIDKESTAKVTITGRTLVLKPVDKEAIYDGKGAALKADKYEIVEGELLPGHIIASIEYTGEITNTRVGSVESLVKSDTLKITNGKDSVKDYYTISFQPGTLTILPREIDLHAGSVEGMYSGEELVPDPAYKYVGELLDTHMFKDVVVKGSQTYVGTSETYIESFKIVEKAHPDVIIAQYSTQDGLTGQGYYKINLIKGKITVTSNPDLAEPETVTVSVKSLSKTYDGKPLSLSASDYTVTDSKSAIPSGYELKVTVDTATSITDAGSVNIAAPTVEVYKDGAKVTDYPFVIDAKGGTLTVNKLVVTLTAASASKKYDGKALTCAKLASGGATVANSTGKLVGDHTLNMNDIVFQGSQTNVGSSANKIISATIRDGNGNSVNKNYEFKFIDGVLTVTSAAGTGTGTVAGGAASGDNSNIGLWIAIMAVLAVAAAAVVFIFFKKKKADQ